MGMVPASSEHMLLSPKYLPRLAAVVGLFTHYGLRDLADRQGLVALFPQDELDDGEETREMRRTPSSATTESGVIVSSSSGLRT